MTTRVVALLALTLTGCSTMRHDLLPIEIRIFPRCADGLPVLILIDSTCPPDGVCGYSCMPERWAMRVRE